MTNNLLVKPISEMIDIIDNNDINLTIDVIVKLSRVVSFSSCKISSLDPGSRSFYFIIDPGFQILLFLLWIWDPLVFIADPEGF
jgi:hypothetical protein